MSFNSVERKDNSMEVDSSGLTASVVTEDTELKKLFDKLVCNSKVFNRGYSVAMSPGKDLDYYSMLEGLVTDLGDSARALEYLNKQHVVMYPQQLVMVLKEAVLLYNMRFEVFSQFGLVEEVQQVTTLTEFVEYLFEKTQSGKGLSKDIRKQLSMRCGVLGFSDLQSALYSTVSSSRAVKRSILEVTQPVADRGGFAVKRRTVEEGIQAAKKSIEKQLEMESEVSVVPEVETQSDRDLKQCITNKGIVASDVELNHMVKELNKLVESAFNILDDSQSVKEVKLSFENGEIRTVEQLLEKLFGFDLCDTLEIADVLEMKGYKFISIKLYDSTLRVVPAFTPKSKHEMSNMQFLG